MENKKLAIVIELNEDIKNEAINACNEFSNKLQINYIFKRTPCLHITLESNLPYEIEKISDILKDISLNTKPFFVKSNGVGVLVASTPVIYIRWKKNTAIIQLKEIIKESLKNKLKEYTEDINWMMKSTLAFHDTKYNQLADCLSILEKYNFNQNLTVNAIHLYEYSLNANEKSLKTFDFKKNTH